MITARTRRVVVIDPSPGPTGALRAALNIAHAAAPDAATWLVISDRARVEGVDLTAFERIVPVPMRQVRRSAGDLALYLPALIVALRRLRRMLDDDDIVVVNDFYLLHGWALRLLGFDGRIVTWVRIDPNSFPAPLRRAWIAAMRRASDVVVAVSNFIEGRLAAYGVKADIIYDPVDATMPVATTVGAGRRLIQIANFTHGKGQDDAIAAFARVARELPGAHLTLCGGDLGLERNREYRAILERQAAASGVGDRVAFGGFAPDVVTLLGEADVALVLSHRESFSLACLEASACGLPVIATRCGGPEEIVIDGETGVLCDVGDVAGIAAAMRRLLHDPGAATAMGARGARSVRDRFSQEAFRCALVRALDLRLGPQS